MHGVRADTSNRQLLSTTSCLPQVKVQISNEPLDVLQKRPDSPTLKKHAISYLSERTKSFDYTLDVMAKLEKQIFDEISHLGGNEKLVKIMHTLHVERPSTAGATRGA